MNIFPKLQNISVLNAFQKFPFVSISGAGNFSSKAFILADILRQEDASGAGVDTANPVVWIVNDKTEHENVARGNVARRPRELD